MAPGRLAEVDQALQLRAGANLILLCPTHHTLIDKNNGRHFSVDQLHRMKAEHEASVERRRTGATEDRAQ